MNSPRLRSKKDKKASKSISADDLMVLATPPIAREPNKPKPDDATVELFFSRFLDKLHVSEEKAGELKRQSTERKWQMIRGTHEIQSRYSTYFYVEQLRRHMDPGLRSRKIKKKYLKGLMRLHDVLQALEVDLRTNSGEWLREFMDEPNRGAYLMVQLLTDIQNPPPPVKAKKGYEALDRDPNLFDEHTCIMCLKAIMANRYGFTAVMNIEDSIRVLTLSLKNPQPKTQALVLKLLITAAITPGGHRKTLASLDHLQRATGERRRFENLVSQLTAEPLDHHFQVAALCFINSLVHASSSMNLRVFLQQELKSVGFDPDLVERSLRGRHDVGVLRELEQWRSNVVDVQGVMDEFLMLRNRSNLLRDEVDLLQGRIKNAEKDRLVLARQNEELVENSEKYHERAKELRERWEVLRKSYEKDTGKEVEVVAGDEVMMPMEPPPAASAFGKAPPPADNIPPPPPLPPPPGAPGAPPPPPPMFGAPGAPPPPPMMGGTGRQRAVFKANVPLPMLNWVVLRSVENTIFKNIDDEGILATLDFSDFEDQFQLKRQQVDEKAVAKREAAMKRLAEQVTLIDSNRARNLVITKRRIGHPSTKVRQFIQNTDLDGLHADHAELLLKFVPTKDELQKLNSNTDKVQQFGEAEEFMHEMAKVERYESRLNVMAFAGFFDELIATVAPQINFVLRASLSIMNSRKLRKLFEVILAFGNYMNSGRRGPVPGFKLESLARLLDTRSTDRKQTLLHFLVTTVEQSFPDIADFYDELQLHGSTAVSMHTLAQDVQALRKGIDITLFEREKQSQNFVIFSFYNRALRKVTALSETYKKMDEAFKDTCMLFGENPKTTDPSEIFGLFVNFVRLWKKSCQDNSEAKARLEEERRKEALMQEQLQKKHQQRLQKEEEASLAAEAGIAIAEAVAGGSAARSQNLTKAELKQLKKAEKLEKERLKKEEKRRIELVKKQSGKLQQTSSAGELSMGESGFLQVAPASEIAAVAAAAAASPGTVPPAPTLHEPADEGAPTDVALSAGNMAAARLGQSVRQPRQATAISTAALTKIEERSSTVEGSRASEGEDYLMPSMAATAEEAGESDDLYLMPQSTAVVTEDYYLMPGESAPTEGGVESDDLYLMPQPTAVVTEDYYLMPGESAPDAEHHLAIPIVPPPPPLDETMSIESFEFDPSAVQPQYTNQQVAAAEDDLDIIYEEGAEDGDTPDAAAADPSTLTRRGLPKAPLEKGSSVATLYEDMPEGRTERSGSETYESIPGAALPLPGQSAARPARASVQSVEMPTGPPPSLPPRPPPAAAPPLPARDKASASREHSMQGGTDSYRNVQPRHTGNETEGQATYDDINAVRDRDHENAAGRDPVPQARPMGDLDDDGPAMYADLSNATGVEQPALADFLGTPYEDMQPAAAITIRESAYEPMQPGAALATGNPPPSADTYEDLTAVMTYEEMVMQGSGGGGGGGGGGGDVYMEVNNESELNADLIYEGCERDE